MALTGIETTAQRLQEENPAALAGGNGQSALQKLADMFDTGKQGGLQAMDGMNSFSDVLNLLVQGLQELSQAGSVMTAGNGNFMENFGQALKNMLGIAPQVTERFSPDGSPAPATPQATAQPAPAAQQQITMAVTPGLTPGGPGGSSAA